MKKTIILAMFGLVLALTGCSDTDDNTNAVNTDSKENQNVNMEASITNFTECIDANGEIMESYPRQCKASNGDIFTEEITINPDTCLYADMAINMSFEEAREIAANSDCIKEGELTENRTCNDISGTWWIDMDAEKEGCNPACVVSIENEIAEINWRCTGLDEEFDNEASRVCVDKCGDGNCDQIVCEAEGCPCAETKDSCEADCK